MTAFEVDEGFSPSVDIPLPGFAVMPCADCQVMLDLADMRDVQPWAGELWRRRIVCQSCRAKYLRSLR